MRMILGLDTPSAGHVTINGKPFAAMDNPMREVGALLDAKATRGGRSAYNTCSALRSPTICHGAESARSSNWSA